MIQNNLFVIVLMQLHFVLKKVKIFGQQRNFIVKKKENNTTYLILWLQERLIVVNLF